MILILIQMNFANRITSHKSRLIHYSNAAYSNDYLVPPIIKWCVNTLLIIHIYLSAKRSRSARSVNNFLKTLQISLNVK